MATVLRTNLVHNKLGSGVMVQKYPEGLSSGTRATLGLNGLSMKVLHVSCSYTKASPGPTWIWQHRRQRNLKVVIQKGYSSGAGISVQG